MAARKNQPARSRKPAKAKATEVEVVEVEGEGMGIDDGIIFTTTLLLAVASAFVYFALSGSYPG